MRKLTLGKIVKNGVTYSGSSDNADNVKYNNNASNLDATNVQEAIDKLDESVDTLNSNLGGFSFKTTSGKKQVSTDGGKTWSNFSSGAELLWTNPAPANSFPAQTLSIDLSNYDGVFIISKGYSTESSYAPVKIFIPKDGKAHICLGNQDENIGDNYWYSRYVTVTNNGITFSSGYVSSGAGGYDTACIPVEIYGTNLTFE